MSSQTLEDMISALLAEEKRTIVGYSKGYSQLETAPYSKKRRGKKMTGKNEFECYYYGKTGHTTINCKACVSDLLKGKKLKE